MNSCLISNRLFCLIFFLPLTAKCGCGVSLPDSFFAHSVICQLDVPLVVQQNVVQLQIAVNDSPFVQEVEGQGYFCRVEPGVFLREPTLSLHVEHQVTSSDEFDHEKEPAISQILRQASIICTSERFSCKTD